MKKLALIILILSLLCSVLLVSCNNIYDDYDEDEENEKGNNSEDENDDSKDESKGDENTEKEDENPENFYEYEEIFGGLSLTKYTGNETVITVPRIIGNKKVVSTGTAFSGNVLIEEIVLPDSVTYADLSGCENLVSVKALGISSFSDIELSNCTSLKYLELPGITELFGYYDFAFPEYVETLRLDNLTGELSVYEIRGGTHLKNLIIPKIEGIYVGYNRWPSKLENVTISENIKYYYYDDDINAPGGIYSEENDYGKLITSENAAYVYCSVFKVNEITVNGILYKKP